MTLAFILTGTIALIYYLAQLSTNELAPLLAGLAEYPGPAALIGRVPLSTDDSTLSPLVDLQVFAPLVVPVGGNHCVVELVKHSFGDGSYNAPVVVPYLPPQNCGEVGKWAAIGLHLSVSSIGTLRKINLFSLITYILYQSLGDISGTCRKIKDVTHFSPLFATANDVMVDFSNIIDPSLLLDGVLDVVLTATFYSPTQKFPAPTTSDLIIPLSNLSPSLPNIFAIDDDVGGVTNVSLPDTSIEAYVEIFCSGNSAEEFWYQNTPDEFLSFFPETTGLIGKGPFREVQLLIDNDLAGVVWPYAVIYTGGVTPSDWRPLASYGAYDAPTYWIDITPFLPVLLSPDTTHQITLRVVGQGIAPTINSNWFVSGSVHVRKGTSKTTGKQTRYDIDDFQVKTTGGASQGNKTVWTKVTASRNLNIESELHTSEGTKTVKFSQSLSYVNNAKYEDDGWVEWLEQSTTGTTIATHAGIQVLRDAFTYPLDIFSNYSLYTVGFGRYGSDIHQTYSRALQPPIGTYRVIHSVQHAKGEISMDNWPGLRHAVNGTGSTSQTFAYMDGKGESYFRDIASKNDGWVRDSVWGTLKDSNPPVPKSQISGPGGGPGFKRMTSKIP